MGLGAGGAGVASFAGAQPALRRDSPSLRSVSGPERAAQRSQAGVGLGAALGPAFGHRGGRGDFAPGDDRALAPATPERRSTAEEDLRAHASEQRSGSPVVDLLRR